MGLADMPIATLKAMKIHPNSKRHDSEAHASSDALNPSSSHPESKDVSTTDLKEMRKESIESVDSIQTINSDSSNSNLIGEEAAAAYELEDSMINEEKASLKKTSTDRSAQSTESGRQEKGFKPKPEDVETWLETGKGAWRFAEAGIKSPLDFTLALAKGFHNAPKLYGDDTVRESEKITGLSSGVKSAGKEFGLGMYDGITGLVTQPLRGAKKEGASGFVKGMGKGIGGVVLKPGAAIWALPGFAAQGLYRELRNRFGPSVEGYIVAARVAQGFEEMQHVSSEEYRQVIKDWEDVRYLIQKRKHVGEEKMREIKNRTQEKRSRSRSTDTASTSRPPGAGRSAVASPPPRGTTFPVVSQGHTLGSDGMDKSSESSLSQTMHGGRSAPPSVLEKPITEDSELEDAIRRSIAETSRGDAEQDDAIERAIRASVLEFEQAKARGANDEELNQAITASLADARRGHFSRGNSYVRAESSKGAQNGREAVEKTGQRDEEEKQLQRALTESESTAAQTRAEDDEQLRQAISESKDVHDRQAAEQKKAADEEEIVMRYVLRQSEAEENLRREKIGESSKTPLV